MAGSGGTGEAGRSSALVSLLTGVPLFRQLDPDDLVALAKLVQRRRYARNEVVFHEGDPGTGLYVVLRGQVRIVLRSFEGKEMVIGFRGPGDFFGEMALLDDEPRSANVIATEPSELLTLRRDHFMTFVRTRPQIAINLLSILSRRLRATTQLVQSISFLDVRERLTRAILELARTRGEQGPDGKILLSRLTQGDLADLVGATRESVNKWLKYYERLGVLRLSRGKLSVLQPQRLSDEAL